ncbi:hypothetical protein AJ85_00410 [Alkalihalobacillus alcalophilus ATCC 27647 = CGMCC 1.3604]|uniref:Uncharacterized protein n=1 Tax=Alkalihalobacillus alcalophilus ATCC 27647 = CGMCC 1.3604 TaxID=1218173 RepID=A0A4S4K2W6_ALKAL|nr:hypothetical protein AJ85_00410 [Alkalihalobacillus alcalophilus ATCC 27647 = CGMCC 1.3604]
MCNQAVCVHDGMTKFMLVCRAKFAVLVVDGRDLSFLATK